MTRTEPEWDEEQQGLILALADYEADQCPGCGGALSETTQAKWGYIAAGPPIECKRCTSLAIVKENYETQHKPKHMQGLFFPVRERT